MNINRVIIVSLFRAGKSLCMGFCVILFLVLLFSPKVYADRGGFSPVGSEVLEPGQKAIVAWNGTDEILILSTDVRASQESLVIEMLPLPSNPTIEKGHNFSFTRIAGLVDSYLMFGESMTAGHKGLGDGMVKVTFHAKIGVHDLTVVEVNNAQDFMEWIINFMGDKGIEYEELPLNLESSISDYIEDGFSFFVFDIIEVSSAVKSVDPIVYYFKSSFLYYPLQISSLFSGDTDILLFTLTSGDLDDRSILDIGFEKIAEFKVSNSAPSNPLEWINPQSPELFKGYPYLNLNAFRYKGSLQSFTSDIKAGFMPSYPYLAIGTAITVLGTIAATFVMLFHPLVLKKNKEAKLHANK